jgi:hypothetical protein
LPIVTAEHPFPDIDSHRLADKMYAAVRKAGVDATEMVAAGLCLPFGPVVARVVVGAADAAAQTKLAKAMADLEQAEAEAKASKKEGSK